MSFEMYFETQLNDGAPGSPAGSAKTRGWGCRGGGSRPTTGCGTLPPPLHTPSGAMGPVSTTPQGRQDAALPAPSQKPVPSPGSPGAPPAAPRAGGDGQPPPGKRGGDGFSGVGSLCQAVPARLLERAQRGWASTRLTSSAPPGRGRALSKCSTRRAGTKRERCRWPSPGEGFAGGRCAGGKAPRFVQWQGRPRTDCGNPRGEEAWEGKGEWPKPGERRARCGTAQHGPAGLGQSPVSRATAMEPRR